MFAAINVARVTVAIHDQHYNKHNNVTAEFELLLC